MYTNPPSYFLAAPRGSMVHHSEASAIILSYIKIENIYHVIIHRGTRNIFASVRFKFAENRVLCFIGRIVL